ncbi:FAD-dependent monooxygenase [Azospirillum sp. TSO35-2]|uniref:NAD(P)/FAD-dependent oxidoreductase n=1 Tax=Azospirillum sp. TSO35-2 TaxID=716796 RepID=UPI000D605A86|nr:FAD-dependent monooxygenase [Azospirillum sp. TSO35-2]PWC39416.1 hypothetical protein TSO352_04475 [Azospirillum sp. TSO35-2]
MPVPDRVAVAIIGGGVAGCATAIALAQRGVRDAVIVEAGHTPAFRVGETVPPATGLLLRQLGLWEAFTAQGHEPCPGSAASWGKAELGHNDFLFDPHGHGWHLDRARFDGMVAERTQAMGVPLRRDLRLAGVEPRTGGGFALTLAPAAGDERTLRADVLVDASGVAAGAARRLGVARNEVDCLTVVYALLDLERPGAIAAQTLLEGAEAGWWYAAKLPQDRLIVALSTDRQEVAERGLTDPAAWTAALRATRHVAALLDRAGTPARPPVLRTVAAPSAILSRVAGPGWLAVGDAASSYDPITAQGIIKALTDGAAAGQAVAETLGGAGEAPLLAYQDGVFARFTDYLRLRQHLYGREDRWPDAGFWRRRPLV